MPTKQKGFTIVELMIAMAVFSVTIMLVMAVVIGIGKQYQKASYTSKLNEASRNIHEQLRQSIAYGGDYLPIVPGTYEGFCAGKDQYFYTKSNGPNIRNGLYKKTLITPGVCTNPPNTTGSINLLPPNGFITQFDRNVSGSVIEISTEFKVGTIDMFVGESVNNNCLPTLRGGDFCSKLTYNSVVAKRY